MITVPENYTDFLHWVKEKTELFWSNLTPGDGMFNTKWISLTENTIESIEKKYRIEFTTEHRAFLRILHAIDRPLDAEYVDDGGAIAIRKEPLYYNWLEDEKDIVDKLAWPYRTILEDILWVNQVWAGSWGPKPATDEEKIRIFSEVFSKAPKVFPLRDRTFLINEPAIPDAPALSIVGSDTIIAGWNLRHHLLYEFYVPLGLSVPASEESEGITYYYEDISDELMEIHKIEDAKGWARVIPFWSEMIAYRSSSWKGFSV